MDQSVCVRTGLYHLGANPIDCFSSLRNKCIHAEQRAFVRHQQFIRTRLFEWQRQLRKPKSVFLSFYLFCFRLVGHLVCQDVQDKPVRVVLVLNGHQASFMKVFRIGLSLQVQEAVTGAVQLLRMPVLCKHQPDKLVKFI